MENPEEVWDENFVGVWHLEEQVTDNQTGDTHYDSTSNDNDGTQYNNGPVTGQIGGAQDFDGDNDYVNMGNVLDYGRNDPMTYSAWIKTSDSGGQQIAGKG